MSTYRVKRSKLIDAEKDRLVLVDTVFPAVVLIDTLQGHGRWIILDQTHTRCYWHHKRQMELQVPPATLLTLRQDTVEDTEKLDDALLTP